MLPAIVLDVLAFARRGRRPLGGALVVFAVSSCAETVPARRLADEIRTSPEKVELPVPEVGERAGAWIGLEVTVNESDSLDDLEVLPGARVRRVAAGGPAARAGILAGDVLLSVDGVELADADGLAAALTSVSPGQSIAVSLRRDTLGIEAVVVAGAVPAATTPPRVTRRIDPLRTRAAFRTVRLSRGGEARLAVEIHEVRDESPFIAAGLQPGDVLLALDEEPLVSAQDLVTRLIDRYQPGDVVVATRLRGDLEERIPLRLWAPPRRISSLVVPILFTYKSSLKPSRTTFRLLDLWLLALYSYERDEGEREHALLGLLKWGTGYGELEEDAAAAGGDG